MEYRKKSYKAGVDLEEASRRREEDLEEVRLSKREENLMNKRGGGEELLLLQSKKLFSDASQTHDNETGEMAVAKAGFEAIRVLSEVHPQHAEYNDVVATAALAIAKAISEGSDEQIREAKDCWLPITLCGCIFSFSRLQNVGCWGGGGSTCGQTKEKRTSYFGNSRKPRGKGEKDFSEKPKTVSVADYLVWVYFFFFTAAEGGALRRWREHMRTDKGEENVVFW